MPGDVLFDALQLQLFVPAGTDGAAADAARAALDEDVLLGRVRAAVAALFATVPALAVVSVRVEW